MRSTLEIAIAVKENQPATEQELRYAVEAMSGTRHFLMRHLRELATAVIEKKLDAIVQMRAKEAIRYLDESLFKGMKIPVDQYLGPENIPGSPAMAERLRAGKAIFKAATGVDLDQ